MAGKKVNRLLPTVEIKFNILVVLPDSRVDLLSEISLGNKAYLLTFLLLNVL